MQCAYCGFVLDESADVCNNCYSPVEGRFAKYRDPVTAAPATTTAVITPRRPRRHFPLKLILLILLAAMMIAPQAAPVRETLGVYLDDFGSYWDDLNTPYYELPESITMTLMRNYTIFLKSGTSANYTLKLSQPGHRPSGPQGAGRDWQELFSLTATPSYEFVEGRMVWQGSVDSDQRDTISVVYEVRVNLLDFPLTPADSGTVAEVPAGYNRYLQDEWKIEPSNTNVQQLATQLSEGTDGNVVRILRNTFDYIMGNYTYVLGTIPKSADETLAKAYGDCDDLGLLYASIARAAGIPAWMELGMIPRDPETLSDWGGHAWVNAVVPLSEGGVTVVTMDLANGYFLWMPPFRLSDWVDDGIGDNLKQYYFLFSTSGQGSASFTQDTTVASYTTSGLVKRPA